MLATVQCTSLLAILVPALLLSYLLITTKIQLAILLPWSLINAVLQLQVAINSLLLCLKNKKMCLRIFAKIFLAFSRKSFSPFFKHCLRKYTKITKIAKTVAKFSGKN
jgi:hypothetical protein